MSRKDILTQEEINALLRGVKNIPESDKEGNSNKKYNLFEFAKEHRAVRSDSPVLQQVYAQFARSLSKTIYTFMSRQLSVILSELKTVKYYEYMAGLSTPSYINVMNTRPLIGDSLIVLNKELVCSLVENYFGGHGNSPFNNSHHEFSISEIRVSQIFLKVIAGVLEKAWSPIKSIETEFKDYEMNPQLVHIASSDDEMMIASFDLEFENNGGKLEIAMPLNLLEGISYELKSSQVKKNENYDANWIQTLQERILDVPVELNAKLAEKQIKLGEVLGFNVGDVIRIEQPESISVSVEDKPRFTAKCEVANEKYALEILAENE